MAVRDIAAASGAIIQIAATIQELGNNWYKASAEWDDFPRKINTLKRKLEFWTKEFVKSGMLSDNSLMETLREAADLLEKEKATLERRGVRSCARYRFMASRTMFPAKVGLRIQLVIDAFDAIPSFLQQEQEAAVALQQRMMRRAPSLSFRDDDRYVPLEPTESKVYAALEEPNGSPLVLLCGGPGKGKSTLARRVALQYDRKCKNAEENPKRHFELVAFLECGPKADITATQLKLANWIGPYSGAAVPEAQGISTGISSDPKDAIWRRLKWLLKHEKILIALDDVCELEFLQKMLDVCGVGVKCLVTAQDRGLCLDLSLSRPAIQIQLEDIDDDVAMQILASHVGFTDKQIPAHIQGIAHKVIEGMEKHPLALASVAKEINPDRSHELGEWETVSESLLTALQSRVKKHTFGVPYPESFWVTTQRSIDAVREVSPDAPTLLILLHMCEAPSVPEEVLKILFFSAVCEGGSEKLLKFNTAVRALTSRGLVNISSQAQESHSWSAHSLQKLFMEHEMNDQKETILKILGRKPCEQTSESAMESSVLEDRRVCISLCALYFHKHYFEKTASELDIPPKQLNSVTRSAIEPITRLLALPVSERWSKSAQSSAKQIYLRYIYGCALHENGIMDLMALQVSVSPMLQALQNIAAVGSETPLIGKNSGPLLKALLDLLGNVSHTGDIEIATQAAYVLLELSDNQVHQGVIMSSGILDTIVKILSSYNNPRLLVACSGLLSRLSYYDAERRSDDTAQHGGIVEHSVQSLSSDKIPGLQEAAVVEFRNLAASSNSIYEQPLVNFPGLLEVLVNLLSKDESRDLQTRAVGSSRNLTCNSEDAKQKIVSCPGAIQQLLASMSNNSGTQVQLEAAETLVNLSVSKHDITQQRVVDFPGLLQVLVNVLSKDDSPDLQTPAARSIKNQTVNSEDAKEKIVHWPGAIQQLLASMSIDRSAQVQLKAAIAFFSLTASKNDITMRRLVTFPGLVEELVNLLSRDTAHDLQSLAAGTLCNLAEIEVDEMRLTMMHRSGLLEKFFLPLSNEEFHQKSGWAYYVMALTYIDPVRANGAHLHSAIACSQRGYANMILGRNKESLDDLNRANKMDPGDLSTLRNRCTVRTRLEDFEGALEDSNRITEKQCTAFDLQERGVLRKMMKDFQGALADLNRGLELDPNDYELLKHRAVVKFLLKDENGAHSDAQMALKWKTESVDASSYGRRCLGVTSVEFLDYKLK